MPRRTIRLGCPACDLPARPVVQQSVTHAHFSGTSQHSEIYHGRPRHSELGNLRHLTGSAIQGKCRDVVRLQITGE